MSVSLTQQTADPRPVSVLSIAGSDSGGGAGIQADLKTFAAHRLHGLTAVAALTAQNTRGVDAVHAPPPEFLARQIDALFADFRIGATKIGMLASVELVEGVHEALRRHAAPSIVLDPVMIASSGTSLLAPDAIASLRTRLLPLADVLTPNLPEAEALLGARVREREDMAAAARALLALGPRAVLLKGGHLPHGDLLDLYLDADGATGFVHPRLASEGHGTGCTLSSAIAAGLALGLAPREACRAACDYVHGALAHATRPGRGSVAVLDHFWRFEPRA
jgi:hydroxymethylpyrimidine/phosphomethylpyrimidine kinase